MKHKLHYYLLPNLVILAILALMLFASLYRGSSMLILATLFIIGFGLFIFASRIARWWSVLIESERNALCKRFEGTKNIVRIILYLWSKFEDGWAFKWSGFFTALISVLHAYTYFTNIVGTGSANKSAFNISIFVILMTFILYQQWSNAKGTPYRNTRAKAGFCWLITVITYLLSVSFNMWKEAIFICPIAFFLVFYFHIKAWRDERYFRKYPPRHLHRVEK